MSDVVTDALDTRRSNLIFWQLSFSPERDQAPRTVAIDRVRFRVGRRGSAELVLVSPQLSGLHAEFVTVGLRLFVRELASTNGTYVNGKRIGYRDVALRDGDRVRMANVEFLVHRRQVGYRVSTAAERPEPNAETAVDHFE